MSPAEPSAESTLARLERFRAPSVIAFLRLFGLALVVDVATEVAAGIWQVHTGRFYPWRHLGIVPLYPPTVLAIEWTLRALAGAALVLAPRRARIVAIAVRVAAVALFVAVLQRYSNHGALLFLVAFFVALGPPDVTAEDFAAVPRPALGLVRAQLAIVYGFSGINKLSHGFGNGVALTQLLGDDVSPGLVRALACAVVAAELALPFVLVARPRAGVAAVVVLHLGFAAVVPNVLSFGLAMIAMAVLFTGVPAAPRPKRRRSAKKKRS